MPAAGNIEMLELPVEYGETWQLCYIIIYYIIFYHLISYHIISYYIALYYSIIYYIIVYYIAQYYIIQYYIIMFYIFLYNDMLGKRKIGLGISKSAGARLVHNQKSKHGRRQC